MRVHFSHGTVPESSSVRPEDTMKNRARPAGRTVGVLLNSMHCGTTRRKEKVFVRQLSQPVTGTKSVQKLMVDGVQAPHLEPVFASLASTQGNL